jgi:hypothetical protein
MTERLLVGLIVAAAFFYAAWALLPAGLRAGLAQRLNAWSQAPGRSPWLAGIAARLGRWIGARGGGCADCNAAKPPLASDRSKSHPRT